MFGWIDNEMRMGAGDYGFSSGQDYPLYITTGTARERLNSVCNVDVAGELRATLRDSEEKRDQKSRARGIHPAWAPQTIHEATRVPVARLLEIDRLRGLISVRCAHHYIRSLLA